MRYHWTKEPFGYCLRDERGYAQAIISTPGHRHGFYGQIIITNMPDSGPYKSRREAAAWVTKMLVRLELVSVGSTFGPLPHEIRAVA